MRGVCIGDPLGRTILDTRVRPLSMQNPPLIRQCLLQCTTEGLHPYTHMHIMCIMCIYIYICLYIYTYIYTYTHMYIYTYIYTYIYIHVHVHINGWFNVEWVSTPGLELETHLVGEAGGEQMMVKVYAGL